MDVSPTFTKSIGRQRHWFDPVWWLGFLKAWAKCPLGRDGPGERCLVSPTWSQTKGHRTSSDCQRACHLQYMKQETDRLFFICTYVIVGLEIRNTLLNFPAEWMPDTPNLSFHKAEKRSHRHIHHSCDGMPSWNSSDVVSGHTSEFTWPPSERLLKLPQITKKG